MSAPTMAAQLNYTFMGQHEKHIVNVPPNCTVQELMNMLEARAIVCEGRRLSPTETVASAGLLTASILRVIPNAAVAPARDVPDDIFVILFCYLDLRRPLSCARSEKFGAIKERLRAEFELAASAIVLCIYNGVRLEDDVTVGSLGLPSDAMMHVAIGRRDFRADEEVIPSVIQANCCRFCERVNALFELRAMCPVCRMDDAVLWVKGTNGGDGIEKDVALWSTLTETRIICGRCNRGEVRPHYGFLCITKGPDNSKCPSRDAYFKTTDGMSRMQYMIELSDDYDSSLEAIERKYAELCEYVPMGGMADRVPLEMPVQIRLKYIDGTEIICDVAPSVTIAELKTRLNARSLMADGRKLPDEKTVHEACMASAIRVVPNSSSVRSTVSTLSK